MSSSFGLGLGLGVAAASSGSGPVLGLAAGSAAAALTGDVGAARDLSNLSVGLGIGAAQSFGAQPLIPVISVLGAAQTGAVVEVARVVKGFRKGLFP